MKRFILTILAASLFSTALSAQSAIVTGIITDGDVKGEFLTGTSVAVKGTTKGTIADANGNYTLSLPAGNYTLQVVFLGYKTQEVEVKLDAGKTTVMNFEMHADGEVLEGVVVSAQAKGQQAAINRQLSASGILNAVSEEKLKELPDVNVAEAIGRLPGLMIQRDGGEGQKIIIRGLDPKYNTVAINGMNAPSTSDNDRSTDLNMISPDMIAGAEVMKSNTADKDADGLGGTVNLIMKDAPGKLKVNLVGESGYHSQINGIGRYKGGVSISNRFFDKKLGVIFASSIDRTDRSNDTFQATYAVSGNTPTPGYGYTRPWLTGTNLSRNDEIRTRYNFNLNFDWNLGGGNKIKLSNIFSNLDRDRTDNQKRYGFDGSRMRYRQIERNSSTANLSNLLQGEFKIGGSSLDVCVGQTTSWMSNPWYNELEFRINTPFLASTSALGEMTPYDAIAPENVDESIDQYYMYAGRNEHTIAKESELTGWLDWKTPFTIGDSINGYIKTGAKYRQKDRYRTHFSYHRRFDLTGDLNAAYKNMPDMTHSQAKDGSQIGIYDFLDNNYVDRGHFLRDYYPNCVFEFKLDNAAMANFYEKQQALYYRLHSETVEQDYTGHEEIYAAYLMSELNIGDMITFIPGVRYDYTYMRYTGYSGSNVDNSESNEQQFDYHESTDDNKFGYLLPQIHLRIKPLSWMDVRLAYTHTLSRPDYGDLSPRTIIYPSTNTITWSRTNLKPALSRNSDITISFYPNNLGLFTISAFHKSISNFNYSRTAVILDGTATQAENFELAPVYNGAVITYPLNSPTMATIYGFEVEAQMNFHTFDNFLKGFVLTANLTWMNSSMDYQTTNIKRAKDPTGESLFINVNEDVAYNDRLINQPTWLANMSLGYDYKKFSARISGNFQDGVLVTPQQRKDAADKEITSPFFKLDAQFKYNVSKKLSLYASWSNITRSMDKKVRYITDYPIKTEYYGSTAYLGIKYDLF